MGLEDRPYAGTWQANRRKVVKYTPDCLVYINGDTALPGCPKCNGRIDLQRYITSVSVDAGVEPGAATGISVSLSFPLHHADPIVRDAKYLLIPGLEMHIYMRGYFPVRGQFQDIPPEESGGVDVRQVVVYPYYHVFHGVVTSVDQSREGGFQTFSLNAGSMLNFWQYQNMSTSGSYFGARPNNSQVKTNLVGNNFNGKTPYAIIYQLYHDVAGAAAGVGFALSSSSNQKANSEILGDNLYSISLAYWQKRFGTKMNSLRMHGASGQVFSTAQAAFLSRLSGSEISNLVRTAFVSKTMNAPSSASDITSTAQLLGLIRQVKDPVTQEITIRGPDVTLIDRDRPKEGSGYELNVAEMQAFVQDITQYGAVNLWESTYETKLAVAQKVMEITGFEFYQDVDGDFVFKPPLYNLDTSSSRVYRIEDIDIYSFSSNEKEPEATYITCKGSQFSNLAGTGLDNEWGVRGQYIDYRLVAQFGWREATMETAYLSNSKAMFFAAVNRMAIINAPVKNGSLTIPLRPEIRPGYPIYVVGIDSYFYVTGLSHSFSFGSRCTTSLQLVARRSKFHAPGKTRVDGIDGIDLSDMTLPAKPLQVLDNLGLPKWAGFPNVVMALDPDKVNPLHFMVGTDFEDITDPRVLRNLIEAARQYGILSPAAGGDPVNGPFVMYVDGASEQTVDPTGQGARDAYGESLSTRPDQRVPGDRGPQTIGDFDSLVDTSKKYRDFEDRASAVSGSDEYLKEVISRRKSVETEISVLESQNRSLSSSDAEDKALLQTNKDRIADLNDALSSLNDAYKTAEEYVADQQRLQQDLQNEPDVLMLKQLVQAVQAAYVSNNPDYPQGQSTIAYLDILSDKKAVFTNGSLPGSYRYYSASHPNPNQQGQSQIAWKAGKGPTGSGALSQLDSPIRVEGFVTPTKPGPDGLLPDAELGDVAVVNGLHILLADGDGVVPTSSIQTLVFAKHSAEIAQGKTNYFYRQTWTGLDKRYKAWVRTTLQRGAEAISSYSSTIQEAFTPIWDQVKPVDVSSDYTFDFPTTLTHGGIPYNTSETTINDFRNAVYGPLMKPKPAVDLLVRLFEIEITTEVAQFLSEAWEVVAAIDPESETSFQSRIDAETQFAETLNLTCKQQASFKIGSYFKRDRPIEETFYSPVFPVSDEKGYELYGTFRYGRGLDVSLNNSLRDLYESDPLAFATPEDVEKYISVLQGAEPDQDTYLVVNEDGTTEQLQVSGRISKVTAQTQAILENLRNSPETPAGVADYLDPESQAGVGLSNWAASSDEFTQKVIVSNVGYMLSDLKPHTEQDACTCRAAEADIALEAFGTEFLEIVPSDADQITQYVAEQVYVKAQAWSQNQDMLRGSSRDLSRQVNFKEGQNYRNTNAPLPEGFE